MGWHPCYACCGSDKVGGSTTFKIGIYATRVGDKKCGTHHVGKKTFQSDQTIYKGYKINCKKVRERGLCGPARRK